MIYAVLLVISLVLFFGFLGLAAIETRRGVRLFAPLRATLDAKVSRVSAALEHVDLTAFVWNLAKDITGRVIHDLAHLSLIVVRFLERLLTRIVRYLRGRTPAPATIPEGKRSAFVETITYFKRTLRRSRQTPEEKREV